MIFPSATGNSTGLPAGEEPFIVPLAIPLVAGPTIGFTNAVVASIPKPDGASGDCSVDRTGRYVCDSVAVVAVFASAGEKGVNALERLMGLILVMMATQMFLDGVRMWMKG